ncbi:hypothetical protein GF325_18620 [Candidatus Bathyarchaeota archaeon]|nr:hypothetical protein [Candidatus Bathyarchaeota archaeon]
MPQVKKGKRGAVPRGSLLALPSILSLAVFVYGSLEANNRNASFSFAAFFTGENWRFGLSAMQTLLDPMAFFGQIWFYLFIAIFIAVAWLWRAPARDPAQWKISTRDNKKIFFTFVTIAIGIVVTMAAMIPVFRLDPTMISTDWYPVQAPYQVVTIPVLLSVVGLLLMPMKGRKNRGAKHSEGKHQDIKRARARPRNTALIITAMVGILPWMISSLLGSWHPRGAFHFNYQFHVIVTTIAYPVSLFMFLATLLLKTPPRRGDGMRGRSGEILLFLGSLMPILILQLVGSLSIVPGTTGKLFDLAIYWWWPAAHLFSFIFTIAVAMAIVTGARFFNEMLLGKTSRGTWQSIRSWLLHAPRLGTKQKAGLVIAATMVMALPPVLGFSMRDDDPPMVLVNQVGYLPNGAKKVIFQAPTGAQVPAIMPFDVIDENTGTTIYTGSLVQNETRYSHAYMAGNFSGITSPGRYYVETIFEGKTCKSHGFTIANDVYDITLDRAVDFYYYQRCGYKVHEIVSGFPGHHACHLDDAMIFNGTDLVYKNLSGGWHDAGDYNKYNSWFSTQWHSTQALADAWLRGNSTYANLEDQYGSDAPDIIDEMLWGARYLIKCVDEIGVRNDTVGMVVHNVVDWNWKDNKSAHMSYWGPPHRNTDNIIHTMDERVVFTNTPVDDYALPWGWAGVETGYGFAGALLKIARIVDRVVGLYTLPSWAPNATRLREVANLLNATYHPIAAASESTKLNGSTWPHQWSACTRLLYESEVAKITGNWSIADDWADWLFTHVVDNFNSSSNAQFLAHVLRYIIECNRSLPAKILTKLQDWQASVFVDRYTGPFHVLHFLDSDGDPYLFGRGTSAAGGLINEDHCTFMWLQVMMSLLDNTTARENLVQDTLDYLFGVNPLGICQMDGVGGTFIDQIHHRYGYAWNPGGRVPGGIFNGIRSIDPPELWSSLRGLSGDEPWQAIPERAWLDNWPAHPLFGDGVSAHSNEIWIPHNAAFLEMLTSYLFLE